MHFLMLLLGLSCAWIIRAQATAPTGDLVHRWQRTLGLFLFSPLLLVMTAIAILCMGPSGRMVGHWEGWFVYEWAIGFLGIALLLGVSLAWTGHQTVQRLRQHPAIEVNGTLARLLDTPELYSAQVGFWRSQLVVSQGLLNTLDDAHLEAVLVHEQAHANYHDTFWFFWLGWLRRLTCWLPHTEKLWQELLMLRELRADRQAAQVVDPLLLAEALLLVVSAPLMQPEQPEICAAFGWVASGDRLSDRIDALLTETSSPPTPQWGTFWLLFVLLPLVVIPFHVS